jgi:hypothetical protein
VAPLGPAVLLLPLVVLVPAGFGVAALTARLLRGSEIPVALAATR